MYINIYVSMYILYYLHRVSENFLKLQISVISAFLTNTNKSNINVQNGEKNCFLIVYQLYMSVCAVKSNYLV